MPYYNRDIDGHATHCHNNQSRWTLVYIMLFYEHTVIIIAVNNVVPVKQPQARLLAILETEKCRATKRGEVKKPISLMTLIIM